MPRSCNCNVIVTQVHVTCMTVMGYVTVGAICIEWGSAQVSNNHVTVKQVHMTM